MKVISIKEPFATLIMRGNKFIETRNWKTNYRGKLFIHASGKELAKEFLLNDYAINLIKNLDFNYGNIICKCNLVDCVYMDEHFIDKIKCNQNEYNLGLYEIGRYAWIFEDIKVLNEPITIKGHLGLWNFNI